MRAKGKTKALVIKKQGAAKVDKRKKRRKQSRPVAMKNVRRKNVGRGGKNRKRIQVQRVKKPAAKIAVELDISVSDGLELDAKHVEITGIIKPPKQTETTGFPGVKDREVLARRVSRGARLERMARLLASIAHTQRLIILLKLLAGEATHKLLAKATGLKAGPLYYHLRELRESGLIGPRVRDLYVLTRQGRRAILAAIATERLCR